MNLDTISEQVVAIATKAGRFALAERERFTASSIEVKGEHNFVSYVDRTCEKMLVEALADLLPGSGFIAEEGTGAPVEGGLNWIVDPLDGTTNYIHGLAPFAVSIALVEGNQLRLGVIYEPNLDECFRATCDGPALRNGIPISTSETKQVDDALIATGFPYYDYNRLESFFRTMEHFMRHSHGLRRLGSAATDLAYVACGRFDAFYEYGLSPWDVAAGALIVQRAGGKVCDFSGGGNFIFGKEIIASNTPLHPEFLNTVQSIMAI